MIATIHVSDCQNNGYDSCISGGNVHPKHPSNIPSHWTESLYNTYLTNMTEELDVVSLPNVMCVLNVLSKNTQILESYQMMAELSKS
jgi:hypothetical protein